MYVDCRECVYIAGHYGDHGPKSYHESHETDI